MNTVIDFPIAKLRQPRTPVMTGRGATLFMHVRNATLIAHLANPRGVAQSNAKVAKT